MPPFIRVTGTLTGLPILVATASIALVMKQEDSSRAVLHLFEDHRPMFRDIGHINSVDTDQTVEEIYALLTAN